MCGYILEIRPPLLIPRHPVAIIPDRQVMLPVLAPPRDRDPLRLGIDAVLDEFRDRLQWIALRQGNDADGIPVVPDLQPTTIKIRTAAGGLFLRALIRSTLRNRLRMLFVALCADSKAALPAGNSGLVAAPTPFALRVYPNKFLLIPTLVYFHRAQSYASAQPVRLRARSRRRRCRLHAPSIRDVDPTGSARQRSSRTGWGSATRQKHAR